MKSILLTIIIFSLSLNVTAVEVTDNPARPVPGPKAKQIGRTVKMTEVFRISDEQEGDFFLKSPRKIRVAPDGSIFVMETSQSQLLKFDASGKFITNMLREGEGPGELINLYSYRLDDKEIIASSFRPVKVIRMDHRGKLIKEFRVYTNELLLIFLSRFGDKYYYYLNPLSARNGVLTLENQLMVADEKGKITKAGLTLPVKVVQVSTRTRVGDSLRVRIDDAEITRFNYAVAGKYMYVTASERYLILLYDFEEEKVVRKFRRQYTPVPYKPNPKDKFVNSAQFKALYKWEFYNDVYRLLADGDRVWALTSTIDKTKGILVDVFNLQGKYIDRFYLQIPNLKFPDDKIVEHLYYYKGFLYTIELDDEDTPYIVKYKLEEG